jgi:hypothetical protein
VLGMTRWQVAVVHTPPIIFSGVYMCVHVGSTGRGEIDRHTTN